MTGAARQAYDLWFPPCRDNFKHMLKYNWRKLWWWKLVYTDTRDRVCSRSKP